MREFDIFEKSVITQLRNFQERGVKLNFLSIVDFFFKDRAIEIDRTSEKAWIQFDTRTYATYDKKNNAWFPTKKAIDAVNPAIDTIVRLIFLLNYLQKNGLIFMYGLGNDPNSVTAFPILNSPPEPVRLEISDSNVVELLIKFFNQEIFTSHSLIELVKNDFRLKSDIQHEQSITIANQGLSTSRRSINITWIAIVVSTLIGLASLGITIIFNNKTLKLSSQPTKIESPELKNILEADHSILNEIKRLSSSQILQDSLTLKRDSLIKLNIEILNDIKRQTNSINKQIKDANINYKP